MMKQVILFVFLLFLIQKVRPQDEKISIKLTQFKEVKAYDGLSINLIKSNENKAVITGANTDKVNFVNTDGVLKIRMGIDKIFSGYRTFVNLYYSQEIVVIDVNEDARITSEELISQEIIELKAQEGGELRIKAKVEQMLIRSVSGGIITAAGASDVQDVAINTGGTYKGKEFKTKFTTVNVNAGSSAEIFASDYVKATVKAGGEVLVYGDPAKMEEKTVFGGKVTRM
jgi:hypothetical protein